MTYPIRRAEIQQPEESVPSRLPLDDLPATRARIDALVRASLLVMERRRLLREAEAEVKRLIEASHV